MGPYPINAVRNLFGAEPIAASAVGVRHADAGLGDFADTVAVTLEFPRNRLAQFVVCYSGDGMDTFTVVGSGGSLTGSPAYLYGKSIEYDLRAGEDKKHHSFKATDQFGGEMKYFSDCILNDTDPEPDGEEGLLDVRVIEAIYRSLDTGAPQKLELRTRSKKIDTNKQGQELGAVKPPAAVHAESPAGEIADSAGTGLRRDSPRFCRA